MYGPRHAGRNSCSVPPGHDPLRSLKRVVAGAILQAGASSIINTHSRAIVIELRTGTLFVPSLVLNLNGAEHLCSAAKIFLDYLGVDSASSMAAEKNGYNNWPQQPFSEENDPISLMF